MGGGTIKAEPLVDWLSGKAANIYTQFGEDGLIDAALQHIGITNRHCFEIGAADGLFFSNTLRLREQGWRAVLIEANEKQFSRLVTNYGTGAICLHEITTDLDATLQRTGISHTPDLGVIDIDGQDYWLWQNLITHRPRVMLVEHAAGLPDAEIPPIGGNGQAGEHVIRQLGEAKGYTPVAWTYCNLLFVDSALLCGH